MASNRQEIFAGQTNCCPDGGTKEISEQRRAAYRRAAASDARFLEIIADVAVARARGRDAPVSPVAAPSRADRATMADLACAFGGRRYRSHRIGPHGLSSWPQPVADLARPGGAPADRAPDRKG